MSAGEESFLKFSFSRFANHFTLLAVNTNGDFLCYFLCTGLGEVFEQRGSALNLVLRRTWF